MSSAEYTTFCPDAKAGEEFEFRSLFIPEEESIDTFYTAWSKYDEAFPAEYKFDRSGWTVTVSDETASDGGGKMRSLMTNWIPGGIPIIRMEIHLCRIGL
mgnify:FL=1